MDSSQIEQYLGFLGQKLGRYADYHFTYSSGRRAHDYPGW